MPRKSIGQTIDDLLKLKQKIAAHNKKGDAMKKELEAGLAKLMPRVAKNDSKMISGKRAKVTEDFEVYPEVTSWPLLYKYIAKEKAFHLLQKRPGLEAFRELFADKKKVPGTKPVKKKVLKLSKLA